MEFDIGYPIFIQIAMAQLSTQASHEQVLEQVQHDNDEAQQFDIGWSIINEAFTNEMKTLVSRINYAKADIEDKTTKIDALVEKTHDFDVAYAEAETRLQQLVEENMGHLSSIKNLRGQVDKLKAFKEYVLTFSMPCLKKFEAFVIQFSNFVAKNRNVVTSITDAQAAVEAAEATFDHQPSFAAEPSPPGNIFFVTFWFKFDIKRSKFQTGFNFWTLLLKQGPSSMPSTRPLSAVGSPEPPSWSQSGFVLIFYFAVSKWKNEKSKHICSSDCHPRITF